MLEVFIKITSFYSLVFSGYRSLIIMSIRFIVPTIVFAMITGTACFATPYNVHKTHAVKKIRSVANERSFVCLVLNERTTCGTSIRTLRLVATYPKISEFTITHNIPKVPPSYT